MLLALSFAKPQQHSCEGIYTRASILLPRRNAWYHYREKQGKKRKEGKVWSEREAEKEGLRVSSSVQLRAPGGSSITRPFEIFEALPTAARITLEIDVAWPRDLSELLEPLLDISRLLYPLSATRTRRCVNIFITAARDPCSILYWLWPRK